VTSFKISSASEKTEQNLIACENCTQESAQRNVVTSSGSLTEPVERAQKTLPYGPLCPETRQVLSLKLERMNMSIHKALDKFSSEYKHFLRVHGVNNLYMENTIICQTVAKAVQFHL
jgi:hypothetical protein